ncbi:MAG: hypothetical protein VX090_05605 [Pseudomonadota bacterium]|nr:hypothetical protein [Pseudomonadota bacterium]
MEHHLKGPFGNIGALGLGVLMIIVTVMLDPAEILAKEGLARLLSEIAHAVAEIIGRTLAAIALGIIAVSASLWYIRQYL